MLRTTIRTAALVAAALGVAAPADAATFDAGSTVQTLTIAVRSITVSPDRVACTPGLSFPNGTCTTPDITITNGEAPSKIVVTGGNAVDDATANTVWDLCTPYGGGDRCTGSGIPGEDGTYPGIDQFAVAFSAPGCFDQVAVNITLPLTCAGGPPTPGGASVTGHLRTTAPSSSRAQGPLSSAVLFFASQP